MKFGMFGGAAARGQRADAASRRAGGADRYRMARADDGHAYDRFVAAVQEAEALGFHSIFLVEHHFTGAAQVSASLNLLTFLAAKTATIRLGTAVIVVPWHNPVLLAEQAATVDVLSAGRLDFGVGKGYRPNEFHGFCVPLEEADERFEESMALIRRAFVSEERFSWHSRRWDFEDIVVEPPPAQRPYPPLWLAAGRPESLRKAAEDGYSLLLDQFATVEVALERFHIYRDAVEAAGRKFDAMTVAVARAVDIIDGQAERDDAVARRIDALERMNRLARTDDGAYVSSMASDPDLRKAAERGTLIGTPEEIVERIRQLGNGGIEYILLAGIQSCPRMMRRFANEVMPAFA